MLLNRHPKLLQHIATWGLLAALCETTKQGLRRYVLRFSMCWSGFASLLLASGLATWLPAEVGPLPQR